MSKKNTFFSNKFVILVMFTSFLSSTQLFSNIDISAQPKTVGITVFIHGTVAALLDKICPSFMGVPERLRKHPILLDEQIIGQLGFHVFDTKKTSTHEAARFIIPAYDAVARHVDFVHDVDKYVVYGWMGLLTQENRKNSGFDLYDQLCKYRDQLRVEYGVEPVIRLVTHSHGGNVALWLACAEEEKKQGLKVDLLFMLAPPVQVETVPFVESKIFKSVILGYSSGDGIQGNDYLSTKTYKSYVRMADLVDLDTFVRNSSCQRCDMRFVVDQDDNRIGHANMWLFGRYTRVLPCLNHFPLLVFVPAFAQGALSEPHQTYYTAHLTGDFSNCCVFLKSTGSQGPVGVYKNFGPLLKEHENYAAQVWSSSDKYRSLVFNKKNFMAFPHALFGWVYTG